MDKESIALWFQNLQDTICEQLTQADGGEARFQEDKWEREDGGGGRSRIIQAGNVLEKGGVNFSAVFGEATDKMLSMLKIDTTNEPLSFFASGVSIVMHPVSPLMPIIHLNVRYFEMTNGLWWFGGGIDLTPHYIDREDARWFHQQLKAVCDKHHARFYEDYKKWADDYFFIKHRRETRGVGGIFFDYLNEKSGFSKTQIFDFVKDVGLAFAPIYTHFMHKNKDLPYGEQERNWQGVRRGRYVEFNLVWDRGTKFGLETDGRTESILMSLPPQANWRYNDVPQQGSKEEETQNALRKGIDWLSLD